MLTDIQIRNAKQKDKPYKLPKELGLFVLVNPNGSKWWRFSYSFGGKEKSISLGTYPLIPLSLARQRRDEARRLVAEGVDPSAHRKEAREAQEATVADAFAAVTDRWEADEMSANSDEYRASVRRLLDRDVLPYLGARQITEIKTRDLIAVFDRIRQRGVDETARRARTIVGQIFRYAIRRGIAENDPTLALKGERRIKPVKHFAAFTDPDDVGRLMRAIHDYKGTPEVRAALKLSALLFQRPGEIRQMQWPQLDLEAAQWRYVVNKTKRHTGASHIVPLPAQAVAILQELYPLTGHSLGLRPDSPRYVFPTPKTRLRPLSENAVRQALRNMGFTNEEMTAHGFRAMARSLLAEMGWKPDAIERQLSHKAAGPLGAAYDRAAFLEERKAMMQAWADYLDTARERRKVVAMRAA
ncbi:tyrosine-type recombinase/integrase [Solimonas marina]|uniref:Integrase arm-type DNA-binding domain-containing protein n=1 Tax=Solimonas marina TaxID=2714601 RepID=A0A969WDE2_9GAMM|nr:integrase arm-type DNA-binding domain-containing protein [Solimonas marina]NKF24523.1 integrase arm-type DNA-binding domain-containing protein [Solimonas marina]